MTTTLTRSSALRVAGACDVLEHRTRALTETDVRVVRAAADDDAPAKFSGHAAVFNSRAEIGDALRWGFYEEIAATAFDKTLAEGDARFLVDHDSRLLVARVSADDLRLSTDGVGLLVDADLDQELSYVRDLTRNLDKRRITGMSFGFYVVRDRWETIQVDVVIDGKAETLDVDLRTIEEVRLIEVSAVTFPAYEETDAALRSIVSEVRTARGVPTSTDSPSASEGTRPAPATATRDEQTDPAPAEATRGVARQDERARALAIRYGLPLPAAGE